MTNNENKRPFGGLLAIDMIHVPNGPFGTQLLCNMGAGVIKVEPPSHGGDTHTFGPYVNGQSLHYSSINHGKESVVLDLKNDHDKSIFINILRQVDILAENFCPGTMEKLGFSWETSQEIDSCLVYASSSGSGHIGPLKDAPAYDIIIQAMNEIMMETGYPDAPPVRVGTSLANLCGGVYLFSEIMSALHGREKSQRGTYVDIIIFDATLSFLKHGLMAYTATKRSPRRLGNHHPCVTPLDVFNTQNKSITVYCGNSKLLSVLCQTLESTELVNDPRLGSSILRVQNQAILKQYTKWTLKTQATEVWLARIYEVGVPVVPLLNVAEAIRLPQTQMRNVLVEAGGVMMPGNSVKIGNCVDPHIMPGATTLNQHGE